MSNAAMETSSEFLDIWRMRKEEDTSLIRIKSGGLFCVEWLRESDGYCVKGKLLGITITSRKVKL